MWVSASQSQSLGAAVVRARACSTPPMRPCKRLVHHLVLLHPGLARELLGDDVGRVVVPVAGQVLDGDLGVGKGGLDQPLDLFGIHGHGAGPSGRTASLVDIITEGICPTPLPAQPRLARAAALSAGDAPSFARSRILAHSEIWRLRQGAAQWRRAAGPTCRMSSAGRRPRERM